VSNSEDVIRVRDLHIGYAGVPILKDLNFEVQKGEIFVILGGSGCGKSTLLKHMIGLYQPIRGEIYINDRSIVTCNSSERKKIMREFGVLYQSGALFASLTIEENITLLLEEYTDMNAKERHKTACEKLALVGLEKFNNFYPSAISGGMKKRAGLARAMALNPGLLFFDEPSAGLDPVSAAGLDRLLIKLAREHGTTLVVVTHELDSIFTIADNSIMLDKESKSIIAQGNPKEMQKNTENEFVKKFLSRDGLLHQ
jgi:phospholipid/cholesterol/gamma-HCH transport system ATP-binding protein